MTITLPPEELLALADENSMLKHIDGRFCDIEANGDSVERLDVTLGGWNHMKATMGKTTLDVGTHKEILATGCVGHLFTASIHVTTVVADGCLYVYDEEYLSRP